MPVVLAAHGSPDPRHAAVVHQIRDAAALHLDEVSIGWLGHHEPPLPEAVADAAGLGPDVIVVPLLLTPAFHARVDVPAAAGRATVAPVLAPDELLLDVLDARVADALADSDRLVVPDALVLAAAGSADPAGDTLVRLVGADWCRRNRLPVAIGYASTGPSVADAVRLLHANGARAIALGSFFLAPGKLHDVVVAQAAAHDVAVVGEPLGAHPDLVRLVVDRARAARALVPG